MAVSLARLSAPTGGTVRPTVSIHEIASDDSCAPWPRSDGGRAPLLVVEPLLAFLDAHGLGAGEPGSRRSARATRNVTYASTRGDARFVAAPPAARAAAAQRARRAARGARAARRSPASARVPQVLAVCDDAVGDRRAVLRDGARRRARRHDATARARSTARGAPARSARSSSTRSSRSTPSTGRPFGLEGFGKPTGYLERQLRRFLGLWEHNQTREIPAVESVGRLAGRQPAAVRPGDDRARRLPARQHDVRARRARAARRGPRLGDGDDRRPAGRPRLPLHAVGRPRRPAARDVRALASRARTASPRAPSWSRATSSAQAARCATSAGTRRSRCGSRSSSWRATTSGRSPAHRRPVPPGLRRRRDRAGGARGGDDPWHDARYAACSSTGAGS